MLSIIESKKVDLEKAVEYFKTELGSIRAGRATPSLVENILVESYGQKMKISQLATILVPEPRVLTIQPWDRETLKPIEEAIRKGEMGLSCTVDGEILRINISALTEDKRKEYIKILSQKTEQAKIKIRQAREDVWKEIQSQEKAGKIREDDKFRGKDDLQKIVDEYNKKIDELSKKKEQELSL